MLKVTEAHETVIVKVTIICSPVASLLMAVLELNPIIKAIVGSSFQGWELPILVWCPLGYAQRGSP
jgi:hypothetical protein